MLLLKTINSSIFPFVLRVKYSNIKVQFFNMPDRLTLIENIMSTIIGISLFTYGTTWKNGKKIPYSHK